MAEETTVAEAPEPVLAPKASRAKKAAKMKIKEVLEKVKKSKVKLTKEQEEYCTTLTKEEQVYYREHGSLRGIVRKNKNWKPETQMTPKDDLREKNGAPITKPQARILSILNRAKNPLSRKQVAELTGIDTSWVGDWIGTESDGKTFLEKKGGTSLKTLGFARWVGVELENRTIMCAEITASGRAALERYNKKQKENGKSTAEEDLRERMKSRK